MDMVSNVLFSIGIVLMAISAVSALIALVAFRVSGRRLREALKTEFGKRH